MSLPSKDYVIFPLLFGLGLFFVAVSRDTGEVGDVGADS